MTLFAIQCLFEIVLFLTRQDPWICDLWFWKYELIPDLMWHLLENWLVHLAEDRGCRLFSSRTAELLFSWLNDLLISCLGQQQSLECSHYRWSLPSLNNMEISTTKLPSLLSLAKKKYIGPINGYRGSRITSPHFLSGESQTCRSGSAWCGAMIKQSRPNHPPICL